jgi:DNA-binding Lrp family transcriptional regulator
MLDELDKQVIRVIQGDIPLEPKPFEAMARGIGMAEEAFLERVKDLQRRGIIRRFGATLRHQEAGYGANAMVAWQVPEDRVEEVGSLLARFRQVSHCYQRQPQQDWRYNLYTMVHGNSREQCRQIAAEMSRTVNVHEYSLLFSEKEFKKTSMKYF